MLRKVLNKLNIVGTIRAINKMSINIGSSKFTSLKKATL